MMREKFEALFEPDPPHKQTQFAGFVYLLLFKSQLFYHYHGRANYFYLFYIFLLTIYFILVSY